MNNYLIYLLMGDAGATLNNNTIYYYYTLLYYTVAYKKGNVKDRSTYGIFLIKIL